MQIPSHQFGREPLIVLEETIKLWRCRHIKHLLLEIGSLTPLVGRTQRKQPHIYHRCKLRLTLYFNLGVFKNQWCTSCALSKGLCNVELILDSAGVSVVFFLLWHQDSSEEIINSVKHGSSALQSLRVGMRGGSSTVQLEALRGARHLPCLSLRSHSGA